MGYNAKTDNFLRAIRRHVSAQKKQMLNEVSQIKEETLTLASASSPPAAPRRSRTAKS